MFSTPIGDIILSTILETKIIMRLFTSHPKSVGETYVQHLASAFSFGSRMVLAGLACLIHGLLPFAFKKTGSAAIEDLHHSMITHRHLDPSHHTPAGSENTTV
jgi:hypothetical protein